MTVSPGIESKLYRSRAARREDMPAVVALYNTVTGRGRTLSQHCWEWWDMPDGPGSMWVIEETATGAIVGHHGLIPLWLRAGEQRVLAGKTENTMVHPDHRAKVLYFLYEKQFAREAEDRFDLLFTTSGYGTPGRVRRKLGYQSVGPTTFYLKVTRPRGLAQLAAPVAASLTKSAAINRVLALGARIASAPAVLAFARPGRGPRDVVVQRCRSFEEIAAEVAAMAARTAPTLGITVERSAAYLHWRLVANPNVEHIFLAARRGAQLVGYAAVEPLAAGQAMIIDLLAADNDAGLFDGLLRGVTRTLNGEGYHTYVLPTLAGDTSLTRGLRRNGFYDLAAVLQRLYRRAGREQPQLLVKAIDAGLSTTELYDPTCWYYTALLAEGLRTGGISLRASKRGEEGA
jgi:hypothetical protein